MRSKTVNVEKILKLDESEHRIMKYHGAIARIVCLFDAGNFFHCDNLFFIKLFFLQLVYWINFFPKGMSLLSWFTLLVSTPVTTLVLDAIFPLKSGNQRRAFPFNINYVFFDHRNYFYGVFIHYAIVHFWIICVHIYTDTSYIAAVEHLCGLFAVTR